MTEIHDNLPAIKLPFFTVFDWIVIALFCVVVFVFLWKTLHSPQKKNISHIKKQKKFIPEKFSLSKEIQELKILQKKEQWKNFSLKSTKILKKILENSFHQPFDFATGKELIKLLHEKISASKLEKIQEFFHLLDPVKFAKAEGKKEISERIIEILKEE
jgi:oligoribonuclease NrnB/cAMP/cGMP phosphodiesterase (DHH superfamily)